MFELAGRNDQHTRSQEDVNGHGADGSCQAAPSVGVAAAPLRALRHGHLAHEAPAAGAVLVVAAHRALGRLARREGRDQAVG